MIMNEERYYTAKQLAGLDGMAITESGVIRVATRENLQFRQREGRGGGREYAESGLPKATREALKKQRLDALMPVTVALQQPVAIAEPVEVDEWSLTDKQRLERDARTGVINEVKRIQAESGCSQEAAIHTLITLAKLKSLNPFVERQLELARDKRGVKGGVISLRTIKRWMGADSLVPKVKQKDLQYPVWAKDFLIEYQRPQKPSIPAAYDNFALGYDGMLPSIHQVRRFIEKLPAIALQKGRMGPRELKNIKPFVRRTFEQLWPNDVWSSDGHRFDSEVQHPLHGRPFKPEVTPIIDIGDRSITGWSVGLDESALTTVDALRFGVCTNGVPALWYVDNGSGFKNQMLSDESVGLLSRLGVTIKHSLPYNSQARGVIERVHQSIFIRMAREMDSYIGRDMDREASQKNHKLTRTGDKNGVIRLPVSWLHFLAMLERAISEYNRRPHSSLPTFTDSETGKRRHYSPAEYRAHKMATMAGFELVTVEPEVADILFRPRVVRKVIRGELNLFGNKYFAKTLKLNHGDDCQVAYDVHDPQYIWVYDEDGIFLGKAELNGNAQAYFPQSVVEMARDKRADNKLNRLQAHIDEIELERNGGLALEALPVNEIPGMRASARIVEEKQAVEMVVAIPPTDQPRERYDFWRSLDNRVKAGEILPEDYQPFYNAFPNTAAWRGWDAFYNDTPYANKAR